MNRYTLVTLCLGLFLFGCNEDPKPVENESSTQKEQTLSKPVPPKTNAAPVGKPDPETRRAWSILTVDLWHYDFALSVTETPDKNIYEGYWIDFEDDFSYVKGYYDKIVAKGYYDYDNDSKILEIIPEEGDDEPSQWTVKTNGEVIILIGTSKFGNNATQIKLVRERERPKDI